MSGFSGHITAGITTGVVVSAVNLYMGNPLGVSSLYDFLPYIALCSLGAMFPDTDTASTSRKVFYWIMATLQVFLICGQQFIYASMLGLFAMLPALSTHRAWTHNIFSGLAISAAMAIPLHLLNASDTVTLIASVYFFLGYLSHLILDKKLF